MTVLKRLLLVLGVVAGLLAMHPLAGLPTAGAHSPAAAQPVHDDAGLHAAVDGSPSAPAAPCDGPGPCHAMAGAGPGCVPLPGGHAPVLVPPAEGWTASGTAFPAPVAPSSARDPEAPSLVELCVSRT